MEWLIFSFVQLFLENNLLLRNSLRANFFFFFCLFAFSKAAPVAYGGSQARGLIGAVATGLHHSHSNVGSEPCLQPTPQLMAMPWLMGSLTH